MKRWHVVHTQTNREGLASQHLRQQGFEVYLPRLRRRRRHARRVDSVLAPMFPRYLFVRMDVDMCRWHAINGTIGVLHLILFGDAPAAMPDGVVEGIVAREDEGGAVALPARIFSKGERLRIVEGAFADQMGMFENMADEERVILLLDLLGRQVRVKLSLNCLATA